MIKLRNKSRIGGNIIIALLMFSILVSFNSYADSITPMENSVKMPYAIVVTGEENIAAYKEAGIIRSYDSKDISNKKEISNLTDIGPLGTSIPTTNWNLANGNSRRLKYSMSSYVYSDYRYAPDPIYLDIWHEIVPDQAQDLKIQCYKASDNSPWGDGFDLDIDDVIAVGISTPLGHYYFKYSSTYGNRISGSGVVY